LMSRRRGYTSTTSRSCLRPSRSRWRPGARWW
jgi:hypothetical protein